jgi:prepilin peptidase CpaA
VILVLLIVISVIDIRHKRIPNYCLIALLISSLATSHPRLELIFFIMSILFTLIFQKASGCGFGDVKLVIVIVNFLLGGSHVVDFLAMVCVGAMISISIHYLRTRSLTGDIAFAPALCGAVLAVHPLGVL